LAKLRSLKLKEKTYIFKAFGNDKEALPAKAVFTRFPAPGENFFAVGRENLFDGIDASKTGRKEIEDAISQNIIDRFMLNLRSGVIDYKRFFDECVGGIENLEYEGCPVTTPADFWRVLPLEAAYVIASELYGYANERDEFTMGESDA
jgi:hypothetical protein